ncbi:cupredoxin domain-containing protein [Rheinheimera baltica]|uniref:Cupredoxin domain-containing protein n=1 Tax=Rheinheimera baltica TaxID=67576 RepID=A0ABT9HZB8_9GAMM|nr:cupredoxin domain-containing protein [Rheinheimera baltica]MDP5136170.1 cupredoxin domain-containing protein [Rheinheimera baltica]MDP5190400.1 cupredoxin domain-containing protein [Rheinheimera baltica]
MMSLLRGCYIALLLLPFNVLARQEFVLVLKDHLFSPSHLHVPAGVKIKVRLINQDATPEEFESFALNREKVVLGKAEAVLYLGPLKAGEYDFFGDFHPDSAKGVLIAVPEQEWQQQVTHVD